MEVEPIQRSLVSHGDLSSASFGLSFRNEAHLIHVLRSTLYPNKELAVLREYSTNAWDAHVDAGIPDTPFHVTLPTDLDPTLTIRDFGSGMSEETVYGVYSQYGESTKRTNNRTIGFLGIGSKSAFAYSDTFTVTAFHGGNRATYLAVIDESNLGKISKVHEEPCGDETGIEIRVPINPTDILAFQREASNLYSFFQPPPVINFELTPRVYDYRQHGFLEQGSNVWFAVMGCVPYRLNFAKMETDLRRIGADGIVEAVGGGLFFNIGEISVSASREEVEYTTKTRLAIVSKLTLLFEEVLGEVRRVVDDPNATDWQKRVAVTSLFERTGYPVPSRYKEWAATNVPLFCSNKADGDGNIRESTPRQISLLGYDYKRTRRDEETPEPSSRLSHREGVRIAAKTRLILRDTTKSLAGYPIDRHHDHFVESPTAEFTSLNHYLIQARLVGIPIVRLFDMPHSGVTDPAPSRSADNIKHTKQFFVLRPPYPNNRYSTKPPFSVNWDVVDRVPQPDDVYVILSHFLPTTGDWSSKVAKKDRAFHRRGGGGRDAGDFYRVVFRDWHLFQMLGVEVPTIYGIKTTAKHPATGVQGTVYGTWRQDRIRENLHRVQGWFDDYQWADVFKQRRCGYFDANHVAGVLRRELPNHALVRLFEQHIEAAARYETLPADTRVVLENLALTTDPMTVATGNPSSAIPNKALAEVERLMTRYPLLDPNNNGPGLQILCGSHPAVWFEYVRLIDKVNP